MVAGWLAAAGARLCLVDILPVKALPEHIVLQADAGDEVAMTALFDSLAAQPKPLRGVFHCTAITDDDPLDRQTPERIATVLRAKIDGAVLLDRLTRQYCRGSRRLDHFVLFSSLVAVLPSARQGAYAAANAVLDQIAQARQQRGLPATSLNWGPWDAGLGRAMGVRSVETWRRFGVTPILPAAGLRALPRLLAAPEPQRVVADLDWDRYGEATQPLRHAPRTADGPASVPRLQAILAPLLGMRDPSALDPDTPLMQFGFDSLNAVEFARALSRSFGRPVAPDFAYSYPTLAAASKALGADKPVATPPKVFALSAPTWEPVAGSSLVEASWTVVGGGALGTALRAALRAPAEPRNLADLSALTAAESVGFSAGRSFYAGLFCGMVERLSGYFGRPACIVLAAPDSGPLAGAVEGFATALAAEQASWTVRSVRLDPDHPDPAAAFLRELSAGGGEGRVRLARHGRQAMRLRPVHGEGAWHAPADGTYLITGGYGGIGSLVAAHLVERGARHLVLAGRRPVLPRTLAQSPARIALQAVDLASEGAAAALIDKLAASAPPLRGIFHAAGIAADGSIAQGWSRLGRAFPAKADAAVGLEAATRGLELAAFVLFSSTAAWFGLPGTAGYAAANGLLDGLAEASGIAGRSVQSIAWCAWQGVGMAANTVLWDGGRAPSLPPKQALAALDAALVSGETNLVVTDAAWPLGISSRDHEPAALRGVAG
jgi:NAD(P)-dependent dehydrogenase (short-subunit alcohol dehydrogenase family)